MTNPVSIQLTVHAESSDDLDELLRLALHNVAKLRSDNWHVAVGEVVTGKMAGSLGSYEATFSNGSPALVALHQELVDSGYQYLPMLSCESYGIYAAEGMSDKKLIFHPPSIVDHDSTLL